MPIYTVHAPVSSSGARPSPDRVIFLRDGFSFGAFFLGPVWLIWHRLWWGLLGYVVLMVAASVAMRALGLATDVRLIVDVLIALLLGFEAASLRRWTLSRRKWRQLDIVAADNRDSAERRFFDRWTGAALYNEPHDRGAPPPPRMSGYVPREDIIGLFPQPGASR